MDTSFVIDTASNVRSYIANVFLLGADVQAEIGGIGLSPHQTEAVARIQAAFEEFGGALLCDAVGSGKTYVGLAVARDMKNAVIIAPAALRGMWTAAMRTARVHASIISTESLSRSTPALGNRDCLIVDEAHHFRNHATRRHRCLAALIERCPVLLITATPIHNSRRDLESLTSLFLGGRAQHLTECELARLIVRRGKNNISDCARIPEVAATEWWVGADDPQLARTLMALPPPVPFRESDIAEFLISHGLFRQWASSETALASALKRRIGRAIALETSLVAGEYPTAAEMKSWITSDDTVQLGFPGLVPQVSGGTDRLLAAIRKHSAALRRVAGQLGPSRAIEKQKAEKLRALMSRFPDQPIIAFASYEATVMALFHRLRGLGHVAAMTSRGGRVAGGPIPRSEIERQFAPDSPSSSDSERIDLLLTTDLLSEGVNLQRARIVVHLDIPWTSARMDQRIGRIARIGSHHADVRVFGFLPPPSSERIIGASETVSAKWLTASKLVGTDYDHGLPQAFIDFNTPAPALHESLRTLLKNWRTGGRCGHPRIPLIAAARAEHAGFIALIDEGKKPLLVAAMSGDISASHRDVYRVALIANGDDVRADPNAIDVALDRIRVWLMMRESKANAGLGEAAFLQSRRSLLAQVNAVAAQFPPHLRGVNASLIARARKSAMSVQGARTEKLLAAIARTSSRKPDLNWLELLADLDRHPTRTARTDHGHRVRALLLLVAPTPPLSS